MGEEYIIIDRVKLRIVKKWYKKRPMIFKSFCEARDYAYKHNIIFRLMKLSEI